MLTFLSAVVSVEAVKSFTAGAVCAVELYNEIKN